MSFYDYRHQITNNYQPQYSGTFGAYPSNMYGYDNSYGFNNLGCLLNGSYGDYSSYGMYNTGAGFFSNCDGTINFNKLAGFEMGNALFQSLALCAEGFIQYKTENSNKTLNNNIEYIDEAINSEVESLGASSIENALSLSIKNDQTTTKVKQLENNIAEQDTIIDLHKDKISDYENTIKAGEKTEATEEAKTNAQKAQENLETYNNAVNAKKKIEKELAAAKKEQEKRKEQIETSQTTIKDLQKEKEKIQAQLDTKVLNKANGNRLNRNTALDINNIPEEFTKEDVHQLVVQFQKQTDPVEKLKYAKALADLDSTHFINVTKNNTYIKAKEIAERYVKENSQS